MATSEAVIISLRDTGHIEALESAVYSLRRMALKGSFDAHVALEKIDAIFHDHQPSDIPETEE